VKGMSRCAGGGAKRIIFIRNFYVSLISPVSISNAAMP